MSNKLNDLTGRAFGGASWLFITTLIQKTLTFSINHILIRSTRPDIFGIAAIQLELLLSTVLFLSREGIRLASLRLSLTGREEIQQLINISWIPSFVTVMVIVTVSLFREFWTQSHELSYLVIILYCTGAFFESLGEPWYNLYAKYIIILPRIRAETTAVVCRSAVTFLCVGYFQMGVVGFGIAQVCSGLSQFIVLLSHGHLLQRQGLALSLNDFSPKLILRKSIAKNRGFMGFQNWIEVQFGRTVLTELSYTISNSFLKHILTEADKIVLSLHSTSYNQGIYAVANNYGSLVARLCFLPVEEASRLIFSKLSDRLREVPNPVADDSDKGSLRTSPALQSTDVFTLRKLLVTVLRCVFLFSALFPLFGPHYIRLLVNLVLSAVWRTEDLIRTLQLFCFYLFILGVNGVSEAFVMSVIPKSYFHILNYGLVASTLLFVVTVTGCMNSFGTSGLVVANLLGMSLRTAVNMFLIHRTFQDPESMFGLSADRNRSRTRSVLLDVVPDLRMAIPFIIGSIVVLGRSANAYSASSMSLVDGLRHICVGLLCLLAMSAILWFRHRDDVLAFVRVIRRRPASDETVSKSE